MTARQSCRETGLQSRLSLLLSIASIVGAGFAVIGAALAFWGSVLHRRWHSVLSLDGDLFPKAIDSLIEIGLYGAFNGVLVLPAVLGDLRWWNWIVVALAVATIAALWLARRWRMPTLNRSLTIAACVGAVFLLQVLFGVSVATMRAVAEISASDLVTVGRAARLAGAGKDDCPVGLTRRFKCVTLWRDGRAVAGGLVVDASEQHIAIFDFELQATRVLNLSDIEIRGRRW